MDLYQNDSALNAICHIIVLISCVSGLVFCLISFIEIKKIRLLGESSGESYLFNLKNTSDYILVGKKPSKTVEIEKKEKINENITTKPEKTKINKKSINLNIKKLKSKSKLKENDNLNSKTKVDDIENVYMETESFKVYAIYQKIRNGAFSYIRTEISFFLKFIFLFTAFLMLLIGFKKDFTSGVLACLCFFTGAITSLFCGAVGMSIATFSNARTTISAQKSLQAAFISAFTSAQSFGFFLPSVGILMGYVLIFILSLHYKTDIRSLYNIFASFGLGGSIAGLFARISGGIYTKAADVGADMVGKNEKNLNEDDPRNPAVIADNVGDNVGDIAGMGADLFGSFGEATCSALIIVANSSSLSQFKTPLIFPLFYLALALNVGIFASFFATRTFTPTEKHEIEQSLKLQIIIFSFAMIIVSFFACMIFLPSSFNVAKEGFQPYVSTRFRAFCCAAIGIIGGAFVGLATEYYTSSSYNPVRSLAQSSETGPSTVIIFGLALGYSSTMITVLSLSLMMFSAFVLAEFFGIVMMALGVLSYTSTILTIDAYGPICDNAGGIAEMAGLEREVRDRTDALDAAGNTTAAIGKGFAICLAYIVGMALLTSYARIVNLKVVNIMGSFALFGLAIGSAFPFFFAADLNKSVAHAATLMVDEVHRQMSNSQNEEFNNPDYDKCINVATEASLNRTIFPFLLTLTPVLFGFLFGPHSLAGFIVGVQISGVPLAVASNNSGGAWDNAKKYIEAGELGEGKGKNSPNHYAAVIGDTVGDPMKDTSGPSINTLMKVVAIISVVLTNAFPTKGLFERIFGY